MTGLAEIAADQLLHVTGAEGTDNEAFGRCGPGNRWQWLGNVYTPQ